MNSSMVYHDGAILKLKEGFCFSCHVNHLSYGNVSPFLVSMFIERCLLLEQSYLSSLSGRIISGSVLATGAYLFHL